MLGLDVVSQVGLEVIHDVENSTPIVLPVDLSSVDPRAASKLVDNDSKDDHTNRMPVPRVVDSSVGW